MRPASLVKKHCDISVFEQWLEGNELFICITFLPSCFSLPMNMGFIMRLVGGEEHTLEKWNGCFTRNGIECIKVEVSNNCIK